MKSFEEGRAGEFQYPYLNGTLFMCTEESTVAENELVGNRCAGCSAESSTRQDHSEIRHFA